MISYQTLFNLETLCIPCRQRNVKLSALTELRIVCYLAIKICITTVSGVSASICLLFLRAIWSEKIRPGASECQFHGAHRFILSVCQPAILFYSVGLGRVIEA